MGWNYLSIPKLQRLHHYFPTMYNQRSQNTNRIIIYMTDTRWHTAGGSQGSRSSSSWQLWAWLAAAKTTTILHKRRFLNSHYNDIIMSTMASLITGVSIVHWTVCSGADQRKHQSSASLAFVRGIHRWRHPDMYRHLRRKVSFVMTGKYLHDIAFPSNRHIVIHNRSFQAVFCFIMIPHACVISWSRLLKF